MRLSHLSYIISLRLKSLDVLQLVLYVNRELLWKMRCVSERQSWSQCELIDGNLPSTKAFV